LPLAVRGHFEGAGQFGGHAPAADAREASDELAIFGGVGVADIAGILCAALVYCEVGAFEVHTDELGAACSLTGDLLVCFERGEEFHRNCPKLFASYLWNMLLEVLPTFGNRVEHRIEIQLRLRPRK